MSEPGGPYRNWEAPSGPVLPEGSRGVPLGADPAAPGASPFAADHRPTADIKTSAPLTYRSWRPGLFDLRPLSFGDFLAIPFRAFRFNRAVVIGGPALMSFVGVILTAIAAQIWMDSLFFGISNANIGYDVGAEFWVVSALAVVAWIFADTMGAVIVLPAIARGAMGERITLAAAWQQVAPRILHLFAINLLIAAAAIALFTLTWVLPFTVVNTLEVWHVLLLWGGMFLFAAGAVVVAVFLPAIRGAIVMERMGPIKAIRRSVSLMRGRFWWTVLIILVVGFLVGTVTQLLATGGQIIGVVGALVVPGESAASLVMVIGLALGFLLAFTLNYAVLGSVQALIYLDARMRREGFEHQLAAAAEARFHGTMGTAT